MSNATFVLFGVVFTAVATFAGTMWNNRRHAPQSEALLTEAANGLIERLLTRLDKVEADNKDLRARLAKVEAELARYRAEHGPLSG